MRLECEGKAPIDDVSSEKVCRAVKALKSFGPSSFASLTDERGDYLQVAGGGVTCMLERYYADSKNVSARSTTSLAKCSPMALSLFSAPERSR